MPRFPGAALVPFEFERRGPRPDDMAMDIPL